MSQDTILVVEDEDTIRAILAEVLRDNDFNVIVAPSAEEGLTHLKNADVAVALVDIVLPNMNGLQLLKNSREISPSTEVIIMTSHSSVETTITAIRQGAYDYIEKPFDDIDEVPRTVKRAVEKRSLLLNNRRLLVEQKERNLELASAVERMSSLLDAGRAIGEYSSLSGLLDNFIDLVVRELKVDRASLMLVDEKERVLSIAASRGIEEVDVEIVQVPLGLGVAGKVAQTGEPVLVKNPSKTWLEAERRPDLSDSFISAPIILSMPIKFQDRVLGVINITNRRTGESFEDADLDYLSSMTGQLAVAIERTKHFEELQRAYESLKATQDQLVISERVQAIGQIAAGVAHDFNNCLAGVQGRAELLKLRVEKEEVDRDAINGDAATILKLCQQGAATIKRVQTYTKIDKSLPDSPVDLNELIKETVDITEPKWKAECEAKGRSIEIRFQLGQVPAVAGNRSELVQLMTNLIFNAVEAMPAGGQLAFRTSLEEGHVIADVIDTGEGMNDETRDHLFEPFFSTKETGQGLGTSVIYAIAARHGGEITVSSKEGDGTAFRLKLPTYKSRKTLAEEKSISAKPKESGKLRLLLVEDNEISRQTLEELLTLCGHDVVTAENGNKGLEAFEQGSFNAVITDLSMPGISGLQVASGVKQKDPQMPVVLLSGWAVQQDEKELAEAGIDLVLAKPCQLDDLKEALHQICNQKVQIGGQTA